MVKLDDTDLYSHRQSLTKLLKEMVLDYEFDASLDMKDHLYAALIKLRQEVFTEHHGARARVPSIGM